MGVVQLINQNRGYKEYLNTAQVAERFGIKATTLRYYRSAGIGPKWFKPEGRALYDAADVQRWIEESRREPSVRTALEKARVCI